MLLEVKMCRRLNRKLSVFNHSVSNDLAAFKRYNTLVKFLNKVMRMGNHYDRCSRLIEPCEKLNDFK